MNVSTFDGSKYIDLFSEGTISFTGSRGTANLAPKELTVTSTTTVQELIDFMEQALGIHTFTPDLDNPIPGTPGGEINNDSQLQFTSNMGITNELDISLSAFEFTSDDGGPAESIPLLFTQSQQANGESTAVEYVVYDSLGSPITVNMNLVLESRDSTSTTYRWFATLADSQPVDGVDTTVGTGLVTSIPLDGFSLLPTQQLLSIVATLPLNLQSNSMSTSLRSPLSIIPATSTSPARMVFGR